jgi:hypothetical protein
MLGFCCDEALSGKLRALGKIKHAYRLFDEGNQRRSYGQFIYPKADEQG